MQTSYYAYIKIIINVYDITDSMNNTTEYSMWELQRITKEYGHVNIMLDTLLPYFDPLEWLYNAACKRPNKTQTLVNCETKSSNLYSTIRKWGDPVQSET
jgi:hypothetical protein